MILEIAFTQEQKIRIAEAVKKIAEAAKVLLDVTSESQNEQLYDATEKIISGNNSVLEIVKF